MYHHSRFVDVFAGLEVVPEQGHAIVYRVPSVDYGTEIPILVEEQEAVVPMTR